jgi:hypothetical protein
MNYGRLLDCLDMEIGSIGQRHGEQPYHRPTSECVAMNLLAKPIEQRAFEPTSDDKVNVSDVRSIV